MSYQTSESFPSADCHRSHSAAHLSAHHGTTAHVDLMDAYLHISPIVHAMAISLVRAGINPLLIPGCRPIDLAYVVPRGQVMIISETESASGDGLPPPPLPLTSEILKQQTGLDVLASVATASSKSLPLQTDIRVSH